MSNHSREPLLDIDRLRLNPPRLRSECIVPIGRNHALVVDNLYADPWYVRRVALSLHYGRGRMHFPGTEALIALDPAPLLRLIEPYLPGKCRLTPELRGHWMFSAMSNRPALSLRRQPPHSDSGIDFAGVVYLNPPRECAGGTAFYRHRKTGLTGPPQEIGTDLRKLMRDHGLQDYAALMKWICWPHNASRRLRFVEGGNSSWCRIAAIEMRFNRLVLYPGRAFHSPYLAGGRFGSTLHERRLTQTFFLIEQPFARRAEAVD